METPCIQYLESMKKPRSILEDHGVLKLPVFLFVAVYLLLASPHYAFPDVNSDNRITVPLTVRGKPMNFIFDTCSPRSLITKNAAVKAGISFEKDPELKEKTGFIIGVTEKFDFDMFGIDLNAEMGVFDLDRDLMGEYDGILSWNMFRNTVLFFDKTLRVLSVHESIPFDVSRWKKFRINRQSPNFGFYVEGDSSGTTIYFDSGDPSCGIALVKDEWIRYKENLGDKRATMTSTTGVYGTFHASEEYWDKSFNFYGIHFKGIRVMEIEPQHHDTFPGNVARLGYECLDNLKIMIDGPNDTVYLKESWLTALTPLHNMLGAAFIPGRSDNSDRLVARVAKDSPAYEAGLRDDDVMIRIDDHDFKNWKENIETRKRHTLFHGPEGRAVQIHVLRNGMPLQFKAVLRSIF